MFSRKMLLICIKLDKKACICLPLTNIICNVYPFYLYIRNIMFLRNTQI